MRKSDDRKTKRGKGGRETGIKGGREEKQVIKGSGKERKRESVRWI